MGGLGGKGLKGVRKHAKLLLYSIGIVPLHWRYYISLWLGREDCQLFQQLPLTSGHRTTRGPTKHVQCGVLVFHMDVTNIHLCTIRHSLHPMPRYMVQEVG